jgi:hypothetical protein
MKKFIDWLIEIDKPLVEKYIGFDKLAAKVGGGEKGAAIAASIGRKKYGKKKFQQAASKGKKMK